MAGGGSQLNGLDRLAAGRNRPAGAVADNPETAIVLGSGKTLEVIGIMQSLNGYRKVRK
jgi:actin-like ATPase involved in cell morphogenesis